MLGSLASLVVFEPPNRTSGVPTYFRKAGTASSHSFARPDSSPLETSTLLGSIREMASTNLIARFESRMDAQLQAIRSELTMQRWLMGLGFAALVAAAIAQLFRG